MVFKNVSNIVFIYSYKLATLPSSAIPLAIKSSHNFSSSIKFRIASRSSPPMLYKVLELLEPAAITIQQSFVVVVVRANEATLLNYVLLRFIFVLLN